MWQQWTNLVLGLWLVTSAYVVSPDNMVLNLLVTGGIVAILAVWGALEHRDMENAGRIHRHA